MPAKKVREMAARKPRLRSDRVTDRILIGLIIASAFSGNPGLRSGTGAESSRHDSVLFFGLAFGMGGLGAAVLGTLADHTSIDFVYQVCAFLPFWVSSGLYCQTPTVP